MNIPLMIASILSLGLALLGTGIYQFFRRKAWIALASQAERVVVSLAKAMEIEPRRNLETSQSFNI